jgi:SAM-dependent methyltransferase
MVAPAGLMLERVIRGDPRRRTRLHDFEGNRIPWAGLGDLAPCLFTTVLSKAGIRWWSPWWPYPAIRMIDRLLRRFWRVLEFGAGGSTPWLARRVSRVLALESNRDWHLQVGSRLQALRCAGVDLLLRENAMDYTTADHCAPREFDFVVVDGAWRDRCAQTALRLVRPGGYVYLDNSDVPDPDHRSAVTTLLDGAEQSVRFVGLCPGSVAVNQGLLIRVHGSRVSDAGEIPWASGPSCRS